MSRASSQQRPHGSQHSETSSRASGADRVMPPPLNLPNRQHKSLIMDDFEKNLGEELKKLDYYEEIRRKPIKVLMTREISQEHGRETYLTTTIKEILIYTIFLIVITILVLETPSTDMYMMTSSMVDMFLGTGHFSHANSKHLDDVNSISDIWEYLQSMENTDYASSVKNLDAHEGDGSLHGNVLIGIPRIRLVRVVNNSCHIVPELKDEFGGCYGYFTSSTEERAPYETWHGSGHSWNYTSEEGTGSYSLDGLVSTYTGGGYVQDITPDEYSGGVSLANLQEWRWVDRATRALIFDTNTYNANVNLFCIIRILFELPPSGGVIPTFMIHTLKLVDYNNKSIAHIGFLAAFVMFFVFYTVEELYEMTYFKWQFIKSFWNFVDVGIVMLSYLVVVMHLALHVSAKSEIEAIDMKVPSYINLEMLLYVQMVANISNSLLIFCCWVKVLKYLSINHSMLQIQATLKLAVPDILLYSLIFAVVFCTFAFEGYILFGQDRHYRTFWKSAWAIFRAGVGDFQFCPLQAMRPTLGPLFFFLALFFLSYVFVVMYIAILLNRYSEVRSEVSSAPPLLKVSDVLQSWLVDIVSTCSKSLANRIRSTFNNRKMRKKFQDVRYLLLRCGFTELEINMFLAKYEVSENRIMTEEDMLKIMQNFKAKGHPGVLLAREIVRQSVDEKLTGLEEAVALAEQKTRTILRVLESMEGRRSSVRRPS